MAARKCINDFSAPSNANVRTGSEMNIGDGSFELKPPLINLVQQSPFCSKASEDANVHFQHFLEIYSTFTIREVTQDAVCLHLFPFALLGKEKQWFYSNKEGVSTWEKCSNSFLTKFFPIGQNQCPPEQDLWISVTHWMRPSSRHGNACRIISLHAPITAWRSGSSSKASIMG
jgi:hypothetical protein